MRDEYDLEFDWRGFELHPETPKGGIPLDKLFPGRAEAMRARVIGFAKSVGVTGLNPPARLPNTRRALAIAELARDQGKLEAWRQAAMDAYWQEGKDLESDADLGVVAAKAGLDPERALRAADDPSFQARVDAIREESERIGVTGIPTFVFADRLAVVGAQPFQELSAAAREAGAERRKR